MDFPGLLVEQIEVASAPISKGAVVCRGGKKEKIVARRCSDQTFRRLPRATRWLNSAFLVVGMYLPAIFLPVADRYSWSLVYKMRRPLLPTVSAKSHPLTSLILCLLLSTTVTTLPAATPLPDESQVKAGADLVNKLDNLEVNKPAYKTVKSVAQIIRNIRTGFIVADALFSYQDGDAISLRKEWTQLIEEFERILQFSLAQAMDAVFMMKTVTAVLGEVAEAEADRTSVVFELTQFMKQLGPNKAAALERKERITLLHEEIVLAMGGIRLEESKKEIVASVSSQILLFVQIWQTVSV
ncbi:hypothetical protein B0H16DRAFT_1469178 [Mycena metata]|uniref:Uncharacterized protein n=1 Tax=Mycena metata TaxID=1033252 RepID=A0AAD7I0W1_9AGAR|nr:hypothetical protein B0H16DRAFT_1469178 [Mycena metata]